MGDLLNGSSVKIDIQENSLTAKLISLEDLWVHSAHIGYLTVSEITPEACFLKIPNQETRYVFAQKVLEIIEWNARKEQKLEFEDALNKGDLK